MINTNNFFKRNTSIRNPAAPYKKGKFVDESPEYKSRVFSRVQENPLTKTLLSMRKNVLGIENALRGLFELDKKKQATDKKFGAIESQEARDKPKVKPPKIFGNIIERPKTGIMDAIRNFVTFTFLGWLFTRLQPFIDKAGGIVPLLGGIMNFLSGTIVGIIDVLSGFIKTGYEVKDSLDGAYKKVETESTKIKKTFDDTISSLGELLDSTVKVATSFLDVFGQAYDNTKIADVKTEGDNVGDFSSLRRFAPPMSETSTTIKGANTGGQIGQQERIDPTKTPITRGPEQKERRVIRRKPDIQQQKTVPGKDVGGEDKVKEVYGEEPGTIKPDFIPNSIFFRTETKSGYAGLLKAAEEYKRPNDRDILGLGNLMGATVDTALGQKLERRTITQFADGIRYLVEQGMSNPEEFKKIDLELMLRRIIEPKIEAAINKIRDEVNKKSKEKPIGPDASDGGAGGPPYKFKPGAPGSRELQEEVERAALELGIPAPDLLGVILAESGGDPSNTNQFGCTGLIQFCPGPSSGQAVVGKTGDQLRKMGVKEQMTYVIKYLKAVGVKPGMGGYDVYSAIHAGRPGGNIVDRNNVSTRGYYESTVKPLIEQAKRFSEIQESASPGGFKIPKADYIKGVFDQSGEPGFDVTWKGNNNIAILPGRVKEVGQLYGKNYGNVVVVESIDPVNGKKVDVLYAHFPNGGIVVREGQMVGSGQVLGRMGRPGERGIGNIDGQHASIDFYESNRSRGQITNRYSRWQGLAREAINAASSGTMPKSWKDNSTTPTGTPLRTTNLRPPAIPQPAGRLTHQQAQDLEIRVRNLLPGSPPISVPGIGRVEVGNDGTKMYYNVNNRKITKEEFNDLMKKYKNPLSESRIITEQQLRNYDNQIKNLKPGSNEKVKIPGVGSVVAGTEGELMFKRNVFKYFNENGDRIDENSFNQLIRSRTIRKKYGGLVYKNGTSPILPEEKYASYNDPSSQMAIAIQPIIIEKPIPVSTGSGSVIAFATPSVSPNYKSQSLSRA